jgi:hypothetical protein
MIKTPFVSHLFSAIVNRTGGAGTFAIKLPALSILNHKAPHDVSAEDQTLALFFILSFLYDERACPVRYENRWLDADISRWRMLPRCQIFCANALTTSAIF